MAIRPVFVRSAHNYDRDLVSRETSLDDEGFPSLTKQAFKDECDINNIVRRFGVTGTALQVARPPSYGDFTAGVTDYHTAMNLIAEARESFDQLPAKVRLRFRNDPGEFVAFCSDPQNEDEIRALGLANPVVKEDTAPAPDSGNT